MLHNMCRWQKMSEHMHTARHCQPLLDLHSWAGDMFKNTSIKWNENEHKCALLCQIPGLVEQWFYSGRTGEIAIKKWQIKMIETTIGSMLYSRHHNVVVPLCWGPVPLWRTKSPVRDQYPLSGTVTTKMKNTAKIIVLLGLASAPPLILLEEIASVGLVVVSLL